MRSAELGWWGGAGLEGPPGSRARRGLTLVEIVVALSVMVVAASIFCQMLISTTRLRQQNRENALATDAARVVIERMRNTPFLDVYRSFNEDPDDDPLGKGTGPGHLFEVKGLTPRADAPQGMVGRIVLPSVLVTTTSGSGGTGGGGKVGAAGAGAGGSTTTTHWQLREDYQDAELGLPRDLNGNNVVDTADHSSDYLILPVRILIQWKGIAGARSMEVLTQLGDMRLEDEG